MRKCSKLVALLFAILLLVACGSKTKVLKKLPSEVDELKKSFISQIKVTYGTLKCEAQIEKSEDSTVKITFNSPKELQGMELNLQKDKTSISYMGINVDVDPKSLPNGAVGRVIVDTINSVLSKEGISAVLSPEGLSLSGNISSGTFYLMLNSDNGKILKLDLPSHDLLVEFENFSYTS